MGNRAKLPGHPARPILIVLPFGLLLAALLLDVIYYVTGTSELAALSFWIIAGGILGGLVAAMSGLTDWVRIPQGTRAKRIGLLQAASNTVVLVLFTISWLLRAHAPLWAPVAFAFALEALGVALAGITGWLGREIVPRLAACVDDGAHLIAKSSRYRKSPHSALPGGRGRAYGLRMITTARSYRAP